MALRPIVPLLGEHGNLPGVRYALNLGDRPQKDFAGARGSDVFASVLHALSRTLPLLSSLEVPV